MNECPAPVLIYEMDISLLQEVFNYVQNNTK